jgi:hypothetical protein
MGRFAIPGAAAGAPGVDPIGGGFLYYGISKAARRAALAALVCYLYLSAIPNITASGIYRIMAIIAKTIICSASFTK